MAKSDLPVGRSAAAPPQEDVHGDSNSSNKKICRRKQHLGIDLDMQRIEMMICERGRFDDRRNKIWIKNREIEIKQRRGFWNLPVGEVNNWRRDMRSFV